MRAKGAAIGTDSSSFLCLSCWSLCILLYPQVSNCRNNPPGSDGVRSGISSVLFSSGPHPPSLLVLPWFFAFNLVRVPFVWALCVQWYNDGETLLTYDS